MPTQTPKPIVTLRIKRGADEFIISCNRGENLLKALTNAGILVDAPCGGRKTCGKCKAVIEGAEDANEDERRLLSGSEIDGGTRLLCCRFAEDDCTITLPVNQATILTDGFSVSGRSSVALQKNGFGIAVDIGTTTVVAYLINLAAGETAAVESALNAQRPHGADVISRAAFSETDGGVDTLADAIRSQLSKMAHKLCEKAGISLGDIAEMSIAGNTIMLHLLMKRSVSGIVRAPFTPDFTEAIEVKAADIGIPLENAVIKTLPCVSGYVGGDTIAAVIACGMDEFDGIALLLDIGTNGEIVLGGKGGMICCSAAAGPAFEGAHISCGTGAVSGAINTVKIKGGRAEVTTIGGSEAIGICGSGLLDAVAGLLENELLEDTGAFYDNSPFTNGGASYPLTERVQITQGDIRQVQLAKSAIAAGVAVLLKEAGISSGDVEQVYLAGGFGNYMDSASAMRIGLLDKAFAGKITQSGNAAGAGAVMALISDETANSAKRIASAIKYLELSQRQDFNELFIDNMFF